MRSPRSRSTRVHRIDFTAGHLLTAFRPCRVAKKRRTTDAAGKWNGFCECGVRARLCTVKRPCTNLGRQFWGCGTWTILEGRGRCRFLLWKDEADVQGA